MERKNRRFRIYDILNIFTYAVAGVAFLSAAPHVGPFFTLFFIILLIPSLLRDLHYRLFVPRLMVNAMAVLAVLAAFMRISGDRIILPGLETLILLVALKFLDKEKYRDHLQIYALSLLLMSGTSLLSLDATFFIYLIALIFLLAIANILLAYVREDSQSILDGAKLLSVIRHSLIIPVLVIPLTLILFMVLPRTSYPFFNFLNRQAQASSGFSDTVRLGNISQIQLDDSLVFRAAMERKEDNSLYWRGIVFDEFDGHAWRTSEKEIIKRIRQSWPGQRVTYTIYLEPSDYPHLFSLDRPLYVSLRNVMRYDDLTFQTREPINKKISYSGTSILTNAEPDVLPEREIYLQMPAGLEQLHLLAATLGRGKSAVEIPSAIVSYLQKEPFRYSLKNLPSSASPLEDFLTHSHTGNCEYFASAMAAMLRSLGIPSRLIGGYRGGYYHEIGQYYSVQQRHAHVWVEAYISGRGWIRYDPTPAASPEQAAAWKKLLFRMRMTFDVLDYYWNRHVINYDLQDQYALLITITKRIQNPRFPHIQWKEAFPWLLLFIAMFSILLIYLFMKRNMRICLWKSPADRLLEDFLSLLNRHGINKDKAMGLEEFIANAPEGPWKERAWEFVRIFQEPYYRDRVMEKPAIRELEEILKQLADTVGQAKK